MENPFMKDGDWYFFDETGDHWGPYKTKKRANKALDGYCYFLNNGPTFWQKLWWPIRYHKFVTKLFKSKYK